MNMLARLDRAGGRPDGHAVFQDDFPGRKVARGHLVAQFDGLLQGQRPAAQGVRAARRQQAQRDADIVFGRDEQQSFHIICDA